MKLKLTNELYRKVQPVKIFRPVFSSRPNYIFTGDIAYMGKDYWVDGYKYFLIVLDVYSRYAWTWPLKEINGKIIAGILEELFKKHQPHLFWYDEGGEVMNATVKNMFKKHDIEIYHTYSKQKAVIAERAIFTFKRWIYISTYNDNDLRWYLKLPKITAFYNDKVHSTLGVSPKDAYFNNVPIKVRAMPDDEIPKFNVGDRVRLSVVKKKLERSGYVPNWSEDIYTIREISSYNPVTYLVKIKKGNKWIYTEGSFYENELMKVED